MPFKPICKFPLHFSSFASLQFPISQLSFETKLHKLQIQIFPITSVKEKRMRQHHPLGSHAFAHELAQAYRYIRLLVLQLRIYVTYLGQEVEIQTKEC